MRHVTLYRVRYAESALEVPVRAHQRFVRLQRFRHHPLLESFTQPSDLLFMLFFWVLQILRNLVVVHQLVGHVLVFSGGGVHCLLRLTVTPHVLPVIVLLQRLLYQVRILVYSHEFTINLIIHRLLLLKSNPHMLPKVILREFS